MQFDISPNFSHFSINFSRFFLQPTTKMFCSGLLQSLLEVKEEKKKKMSGQIHNSSLRFEGLQGINEADGSGARRHVH